MKKLALLFMLSALSTMLLSQNLEIDGKTKITDMDSATPSAQQVAREPDGTLSLMASATTGYTVGDYAYGGVVFWVDENGQHGLVCAIEDQDGLVQWYDGTPTAINVKRSGVYGGASNTEQIMSLQDIGFYAASLCSEYTGGDYGDWYLPGRHELLLIYQNRATINTTALANGGTSFLADTYWSSTAAGAFAAWVRDFNNGLEYTNGKNNNSRVRAIRAF